MKILVNEMPINAKACLFSVPAMVNENGKIIHVDGCSINQTLCIYKDGKCRKLKKI